MGILRGTPGKKTKKKRHKQSEMLRHHKIGTKEIREAEEEYYEDVEEYYEDGDEEYYEEADGEYYEEEAGDEYYEEADGEYYEEEADGEYYEEADGEYYEEEADGEYYEEEADGEYYEEETDGVYYEEADGEYYEDADGEYYEEEADGEYYEEKTDGEFYETDGEDADFYEGEIGYEETDGDYYEDDEEYYEDDEDEDLEYSDEEYDEDEEYEDDSPRSRRDRKEEKERTISVVDILLGVIGIAVAVVVIFSLSIVRNIRNTEAQVNSFEDLVLDLEDAGVIGQRGLVAMNIAMLKGGTNIQEEDTVVVIPEDNAVSKVNVSLKTASVVKDLKIKFTNSSSGKLIASVPFKVLVTTPSGKQETWEDSDQDGIIYYSGIAGGVYTLAMAALDDRYADYQIDSVTQKVEVKSQIEYRKVDVTDEVKTEAEVNVAKEDTAAVVQDTVTESVLTDTVEFVTSTVTDAENGTYSEVAKSTIPDPATLTSYFMEVLALPATESGNVDNGNSGSNNENNTGSESGTGSENGSGSGSTEGNTTEESKESQSSEESKTEESKTEESQAEETKTEETKEVTTTGSISLDKNEMGLKVGESVTLKAAAKQITKTKTTKTTKVTGKDPVSETTESEETKDVSDKVTWSSSDSSIAEVKDGAVKGLKAGTAKITAKVTVDGKDYTAECTVTVSVEDKLSLSASSITIGVGASGSFNATISPENATVTAASSDEKIAKVSVSGTSITVTGVAAGTVKITVTGSNKLTAACDVTVTAEPALTLSANKLTVGVKKTGTVTVTTVPDTAKISKVESNDAAKATAEFKDKTVTVTGVAAGTCKITVTGDNGKSAELEVTVVNTAENDTTSKLKDSSGNQVYVLDGDKYREAVYADYYKDGVKFYLYTAKKQYTGWQTIGGKTYFYKADHTPVTGKQIIQGAEYLFGDDGALATGTPTLGIDVSKWNGSVDWDSVSKAGVSYAIIRCGYRGSSTGALIVDPKFETNISKAKAAGMQVGVYFFTQAVSETEAVEEASMVLSQVSKYSLNYPIYLDVESSGGRGDKLTKEERTAVIRAFCNTIQNSGYSAGVYANKTWLAEKMDVNQLGSFKIWLAQYAAAPTYTGRYNMWQYTSKGTLPGITGDVDMNLSY